MSILSQGNDSRSYIPPEVSCNRPFPEYSLSDRLLDVFKDLRERTLSKPITEPSLPKNLPDSLLAAGVGESVEGAQLNNQDINNQDSFSKKFCIFAREVLAKRRDNFTLIELVQGAKDCYTALELNASFDYVSLQYRVTLKIYDSYSAYNSDTIEAQSPDGMPRFGANELAVDSKQFRAFSKELEVNSLRFINKSSYLEVGMKGYREIPNNPTSDVDYIPDYLRIVVANSEINSGVTIARGDISGDLTMINLSTIPITESHTKGVNYTISETLLGLLSSQLERFDTIIKSISASKN